MSIRVAIKHSTEYRFDRPVNLSPHVIRLRPAPHTRTPIDAYSMRVHPEEHYLNWQQDPFGNFMARLIFNEKASRLAIDVEVVAEMVAINPFDFFLDEDSRGFPTNYGDRLRTELEPYLAREPAGPALRAWLAEVPRSHESAIDFLVDLNQQLQQDIGYVIRFDPGVQSCEETLTSGRGSCRDSGWLLVQILRHLGFAARFVSGYLVQLTSDQESLDGPSGPTADFSDLHAWTEVFLPGAGWVGLDPTSGLFAGEGHIPLAATPDFHSAAPIEGRTDKCEVEFSYSNTVERIHEDPRVTLPYTPAKWAEIDALGHRVDARLAAGDVRLTMGGEPTFVSIDDFESAEWTIAADGPHKRQRAEALLRRLHRRWAPGGLVHHGTGKWYPGEPLPRWAYSAFWRRDGVALWQDPALLAGLNEATAVPERSITEAFLSQVAERLELSPRATQAAFEDVYYYLWKEGTLPINVDPRDSRLSDPLERQRLRRLFEGDLNKPAGHLLPLRRDPAGGWHSTPWPLRRGHVFLLPGDSPMGLRLPLDSLPAATGPAPLESYADPLTERQPLPPRGPQLQPRPGVSTTAAAGPAASSAEASDAPASRRPDAENLARTALCAELRGGRLHLFLPPTHLLEDFVELIHAIEETAADLRQPVVLEGYEPVRDPRLNMFQITPDPGVIEANVQPASTWTEMQDISETLYDEARRARLGTEKFMLDGRHTGTGGGNHVTLGGPTPADSPLLRRPDLLGSLVRYWQNHPSLSYLFSGAFIGPTSQAPRVDEARDDSLHELEIALAQLPGADASVPPWVVDRIIRNQLTDLTGNTHRSEFCVDKLYSPDGPHGRRGLLEFRAFEMPPHPQMSLAQMLLLRGLVAAFWDQPYERRPIRWNTELHDRFMLPYFVRTDFEDVIEELRGYDLPFAADWYEPFFEFRFPRFGTIGHRGMALTLRTALEPWHVLGEEATGAGTARYVDSSVERLQVELSGFIEPRYAVTCNGYEIPLAPTGTRGEFVGGVRFKAWAPPSSEHPTIPSHAPLVFDIVDRRNGRPVAGCRYHVVDPTGRGHDHFPVNSREAEARRLARFEPFGHSIDGFNVRPTVRSPDTPFTLDLRQQR